MVLHMTYEYIFPQVDDTSSTENAIIQAIVENVGRTCDCTFTEDRITDQMFRCFRSSREAVTYRARLHGTGEATVTELLQDIEAWVQAGPVNIQLLTVNRSCAVGIDSFNKSECVSTCEEPVVTTVLEDTDPSPESLPVAAIAGAVGAVAVLIILIVVILVVVAVCKHKDSGQKEKQ